MNYAIVLVTFYSILNGMAIMQGLQIIQYGHNRQSPHFRLLCLTCFWLTCRVIFWYMTTQEPSWPYPVLICLFSIPIAFQFGAYGILILFYTQVVHAKHWEQDIKMKVYTVYWLSLALSFTSSVVLCLSAVVKETVPEWLEIVQGIMQSMLWTLLAIFLIIYGIRFGLVSSQQLKRLPRARIYFTLVNTGLCLVFVSRAMYYVVAIIGKLPDRLVYIAVSGPLNIEVFIIYCIWELLPTFLLLLLLWRIPSNNYTTRKVTLNEISQHVSIKIHPPLNDGNSHTNSRSHGNSHDNGSSISRTDSFDFDEIDPIDILQPPYSNSNPELHLPLLYDQTTIGPRDIIGKNC